MAKKKAAKEMSGGCLMLFGLPFLAAGLFISWLYFSGLASWWSARTWDEVPCWIERAELEVSSDSDSTTYQATASYRYDFEGRTYHSERVLFQGGKDNIGSFQKDAHRELSRYVEKNGDAPTFRCYVNPRNPSEAVLYRTFRWPMLAFFSIFALTFPAVGAGVVIGGWIGRRRTKEEAVLRKRHPEEPWKWKAAWQTNIVPEHSTAWRKGAMLYTVWSGLVILPMIAATAVSGEFQTDPKAWLLLILVALWCIPAGLAVKALRRRFASGSMGFELKEMPAWPGGELRGDIVLEKPLPLRGDPEVEFVCEKSVTRSSGDGDTTTAETIWSHRETVSQSMVMHDVSGFRLPVKFAVPADAPESGPTDDPSTKHEWLLRLKVPGTPIESAFEVPVFRTEKSPDLTEVATAATPSIHDEALADLPARLAERRIHAEFDSAGTPLSIYSPPARNLAGTVSLFVFTVIWTGVAVFLIRQNAPLVFQIIWPVTAALMWVGVIWGLLHKRTVTFSGTGVEVRNQVGPIISTQVFEKGQITGFSHDSNMSSGNKSFYRVRLETAHWKKKTLVDGITESATAEALVKRLKAWKTSA